MRMYMYMCMYMYTRTYMESYLILREVVRSWGYQQEMLGTSQNVVPHTGTAKVDMEIRVRTACGHKKVMLNLDEVKDCQ